MIMVSWERGEIICRHGDDINGETLINPSETIAVQQNNGKILFNIRSESLIDRRLIAHSPDGATNWNIQGFDDALLEPVCMASILKSNYNNEKNLKEILFVNPDNLENDLIPTGRNLRHDRKRLTVKVSTMIVSPGLCRKLSKQAHLVTVILLSYQLVNFCVYMSVVS